MDHFLRYVPQRSPPDTHKDLLEEEVLPLAKRRKVPENATEEACVCNFIEQVEPEVSLHTFFFNFRVHI